MMGGVWVDGGRARTGSSSRCVCVGFSIEGPSQAKIECDDKGDGSCDVRYWPLEAGDYAVHVICDDEDVKDSPFMAHILPATAISPSGGASVLPEQVRVLTNTTTIIITSQLNLAEDLSLSSLSPFPSYSSLSLTRFSLSLPLTLRSGVMGRG